MEITAKLSYLRISPRKVRLVANLIKGLNVPEADRQLDFLPKRAAKPLLKLLRSAAANAEHNLGVTDRKALKVANVIVENGPTLKRWRARARGRAASVLKRTSHVKIILHIDDKAVSRKPAKTAPVVIPQQAAAKQKQTTQNQLIPQTEASQVRKPNAPVPARPDRKATAQSRNRLFSRQTWKNAKKFFRRKSI